MLSNSDKLFDLYPRLMVTVPIWISLKELNNLHSKNHNLNVYFYFIKKLIKNPNNILKKITMIRTTQIAYLQNLSKYIDKFLKNTNNSEHNKFFKIYINLRHKNKKKYFRVLTNIFNICSFKF